MKMNKLVFGIANRTIHIFNYLLMNNMPQQITPLLENFTGKVMKDFSKVILFFWFLFNDISYILDICFF